MRALLAWLILASAAHAQSPCLYVPDEIGDNPSYDGPVNMSYRTAAPFAADWLPWTADPQPYDCEGGEAGIAAAQFVLKMTGDAADYGGEADHCQPSSAYAELISALVAIALSDPPYSNRLDVEQGPILHRAITYLYRGITSTKTECEGDHLYEFAAHISGGGAMRVGPKWIWPYTIATKAASVIHEVSHIEPEHISHNGCWSDGLQAYTCALAWSYGGDADAFQTQIIWMSQFAQSPWWGRHRTREIETDGMPWTVTDAKTEFGQRIEAGLEQSFRYPPCITVETNPGSDDWGKLSYSACDADSKWLETLTEEELADHSDDPPESESDESDPPQTEPEPEPEPEEDECYYEPRLEGDEWCTYDICPDMEPWLLWCVDIGDEDPRSDEDEDDGVAENDEPRDELRQFCYIGDCRTPFIDGRCPNDGCWLPLSAPNCDGEFEPDPCMCSENCRR